MNYTNEKSWVLTSSSQTAPSSSSSQDNTATTSPDVATDGTLPPSSSSSEEYTARQAIITSTRANRRTRAEKKRTRQPRNPRAEPRVTENSRTGYVAPATKKTITGSALIVVSPLHPTSFYLISERKGKPFNLPGGSRQEGESPLDTLIRELAEEGVSYTVPPRYLFASQSHDHNGDCVSICHTYVAHYSEVNFADDVDYKLATYDQIMENKTHNIAAYVVRVINHYFDHKMSIYRSYVLPVHPDTEHLPDFLTPKSGRRSDESGPKDGGKGSFNPYGNGQTGMVQTGTLLANWSGADTNFNGKWRFYTSLPSITAARGLRQGQPMRFKLRFQFSTSGVSVPTLVPCVVMIHNLETPYPSYASHSFDVLNNMYLQYISRSTASPALDAFWYIAEPQSNSAVWIPPWVQPNAAGVSFNPPVYYRLFNATSQTRGISWPTEFVQIEDSFTPTFTAPRVYVTVGFVANGFLTDIGYDNWVIADFTLYDEAKTIVKEISTPIDIAGWSSVGGLPLEVNVTNVPLPVSMTGSIAVSQPVWVTNEPSSGGAPDPAQLERPAGLKDDGKGGFNPYGNGQTSFFGLAKRNAAPSAAPVTTNEMPAHYLDANVVSDFMSDAAFDVWFDNWIKHNKAPVVINMLMGCLYRDKPKPPSLPPQNSEDFELVETAKASAAAVNSKGQPNINKVSGHGNYTGKPPRTEQQKAMSQDAAVERTVATLSSPQRYFDWITLQKPSQQWAERVWQKANYRQDYDLGHAEIIAVATLQHDVYSREYILRYMMDQVPEKVTDLPNFLYHLDVDATVYGDDSGYDEWLAKTRSKRMHALVGNTTADIAVTTKSYWDCDLAMELAEKPQTTSDLNPAQLARFFGLGFTSIPDNVGLLTQSTYLTVKLQNAVGNVDPNQTAVPSFTQAGITRNVRPPGGGPLGPAVIALPFTAVATVPSPRVVPETSNVYNDIQKSINDGRTQQLMFPNVVYVTADLITSAALALSSMPTDLITFFMKAHLYRRIPRYEVASMGTWTPTHEWGCASPNSIVSPAVPMTVIWGGSPSFDEDCNLLPPGNARLPTLVGADNNVNVRIVTQFNVARVAATSVVMPYSLIKAFQDRPGKALAMYLMCLLRYPVFVPTINVFTADDQGANAAGERFVPSVACVQIPGVAVTDIDVVWPLVGNQRPDQVNQPILPANRVLYPPTNGPTIYQGAPAGAALPVNGQPNALNTTPISSFIAGWIDTISEADWLTFISNMVRITSAQATSNLADTYAMLHTSHVSPALAEGGAGPAVNLGAPLPRIAVLHAAPCQPDGRTGLVTANGNVTGPTQAINEAFYQVYNFSIDYLNGLALNAIKPVVPSYTFSRTPMTGPIGWIYDLVEYRRYAAAHQAFYHALRIPAGVWSNAFLVQTPLPVVAALRNSYVNGQGGDISEAAADFAHFFNTVTQFKYCEPSQPGMLTAKRFEPGVPICSTIISSEHHIPAYIIDSWMNALIGQSIEWVPYDAANTDFLGRLAKDEPWGNSFAAAQILPIAPELVYPLTNFEGWPKLTQTQIGNARIIARLQSPVGGPWTQQIVTSAGVALAAPVTNVGIMKRYATNAQFAYVAVESWSSFVNTKASYSQSVLLGIPQTPVNSFYATAPGAIQQLTSFIGGNTQINLPTLQRTLKPSTNAFYNGAGNKTAPGIYGKKTNASSVPATATGAAGVDKKAENS